MSEEITPSSLLGKIAAYTEILSKDPRSTIFVSLSEAYRKLGHFEDARRIVEEGLQQHADFSPAYVVLGRILCQQGDYQSSAAMFSRALELDGKSLAALVGYARLAVLTEDYGRARQLLLKARSFSPADPVINKFINSLPESAGQESGEELNADAGTPLVSETLADLYLKQGLPEKALEVLRELLSNDQDNLKLRRKIRDAELQIEGVTETAGEEQDSAEEALATETEIEQEPEIESAPEIEQEPVAASPPANAGEEMTPLAILNRWLENIQKRRVNV